MIIKLNECSFDKLDELLNSNEEILFKIEYAFDKNLLIEINKRCKRSVKLSFIVGKDINIDLLKLIPNIQHLSLRGDSFMREDSTIDKLDVLSDFKNLETLLLGMYVKRNISFAPIMHIKTLHEFKFTEGALAHKTQYDFINQQNFIEKLHVNKMDVSLMDKRESLTDIRIFRTLKNEHLLADKFPNIKKFDLHGDSQRQDFSFIENLQNIEDITINYNKHLTKFPQLKNPTKVKRICMLECPNFSDIENLLPFENLEILYLTSHNKSLQFPTEDFHKLKQLKKLRKVYTVWGRKQPEIVKNIYKETGWINSMGDK